MRHYLLLFCAALSFVSTGCGPSLRSEISVPRLIPAGAPEARRPSRGSFIFVDQFLDTRPGHALVRIDGRDVRPETEPADEVVAGLKRALERDGFAFSDTAPVILSGELRVWSAEVKDGFSAKAEASSQLFIEVLDPANKRVYSGVYEGFAAKQSPGLSESDVKDALQTSMTEAIRQVMVDTQLIGLLASY
jgi:hypothetical protein